LVSLTSAGQITPAGKPPYFVVIDRALRDEGTSYHYVAPSEFAEADPHLIAEAKDALAQVALRSVVGPSWTTDAPFRETAEAIEAARRKGILAVEMEAAALYAFAKAQAHSVLCLAHVTNAMGQNGDDFEKGERDGAADAMRLLAAIIRRLAPT
jgi:uridine phosphorylase